MGKWTCYFSKEQQIENKSIRNIISYQVKADHDKLRFLLTLAIMTDHQEDRANLHCQRCRNISQYNYSKVIKTKRGVSSKTKKRTTITVVSPLGLYMKDSKWAFCQDIICTLMIIVALFTIAMLWNQPVCPLEDEWIRKCRYILCWCGTIVCILSNIF